MNPLDYFGQAIQRGDLVRVAFKHRQNYWHWAIYVGPVTTGSTPQETIEHAGSDELGLLELDGNTVQWTSWNTFCADRRVERVSDDELGAERDSADNTIARARRLLGVQGYTLLFWNCETFARHCATGIPYSHQVLRQLPAIFLAVLCFALLAFGVVLASLPQADIFRQGTRQAPWQLTTAVFVFTSYLICTRWWDLICTRWWGQLRQFFQQIILRRQYRPGEDPVTLSLQACQIRWLLQVGRFLCIALPLWCIVWNVWQMSTPQGLFTPTTIAVLIYVALGLLARMRALTQPLAVTAALVLAVLSSILYQVCWYFNFKLLEWQYIAVSQCFATLTPNGFLVCYLVSSAAAYALCVIALLMTNSADAPVDIEHEQNMVRVFGPLMIRMSLEAFEHVMWAAESDQPSMVHKGQVSTQDIIVLVTSPSVAPVVIILFTPGFLVGSGVVIIWAFIYFLPHMIFSIKYPSIFHEGLETHIVIYWLGMGLMSALSICPLILALVGMRYS